MPYTVNKSNGDIATVISDYQTEILAGLKLAGLGYVGYGELTAQNFVRLAENFSAPTPPDSPLTGQIWMDTSATNPVLKSYTGSTWMPLFSLDLTNNQALIYYDGSPIAPDIDPIPGTLVVRGSDGKIPSSSLPEVGSVADAAHATEADTADKLKTPHSFGSRNGGLSFDGTQDVPLTTSHIAEGDQEYFTTTRAIGALKEGRYISINPSTGEIAFNGPDPTSGSTGAQGPKGDTGATGPQGPAGPTGPAGPKGDQGIQGPPGLANLQGLVASAGTNAYFELPASDGHTIIYQAGYVASTSNPIVCTFPIAFPTRAIAGGGSPIVSSAKAGGANDQDNYVAVTKLTNTYMYYTVSKHSGDELCLGCYWWAIGC